MTEENGEKKPRELKITVDSQAMKDLALSLAKEQLKVASLEEKSLDKSENKSILFKSDSEEKPLLFKSGDDLATRKLDCYNKFHDERFLKAESKEELSQMVTNLVNEVAASRKQAPSGSAPLNDRQMGSNSQIDDLYRHKFQNEREMIQTLRDLAHSGNEEAKSYLANMIEQFIKSKKQNPNAPDSTYNPNDPQNLPDLKKEGQFLTTVRKEDGDIGKILEAWKKERNAKREGNQA